MTIFPQLFRRVAIGAVSPVLRERGINASVGRQLTTSEIDVLLARNVASPRYTASTLCVPCGGEPAASDIAAVVLPVWLSVPCPRTDPFSMNSTTPLGALFCDPVTVAVSVTVDPNVAGAGEAASAIVEVRVVAPEGWTYCANAGDELGGIVELPRYLAVIAWPPAASDAVVSWAVASDSATVPSNVAPS